MLQDFNFIGRGGGLVVTINSLGDFDFTIQNCLLENNNAKSVGGGIYLAFSAHRAHKAVVRNVTLKNNTSPVAGGLVLAKVGGIDEGTIRLEIYNSHFESNHARFGGGFFLYADSKLVMMYIKFTLAKCMWERKINPDARLSCHLLANLVWCS